jgi:hypothetical protein
MNQWPNFGVGICLYDSPPACPACLRGFARAADPPASPERSRWRAGFAEVNICSIAVDPAHLSETGTPAMEKHSAAFAAGRGRPDKLYPDIVCHRVDLLAKGLCHFAFRRPPLGKRD